MIGLEHVTKEIEKLVTKAYEKGIEEGVAKDNFLSEEELNIFNAYIDDCMDSVAFGNSDWMKVYSKITNRRWSKKAFEYKLVDKIIQ